MGLKQRPFAGLAEAILARALEDASGEAIKAWQINVAWRQHRQEIRAAKAAHEAQKALEVARSTARKAVEVTIEIREEAAAASHARAMARLEALNRAKATTLARAAARARHQAMLAGIAHLVARARRRAEVLAAQLRSWAPMTGRDIVSAKPVAVRAMAAWEARRNASNLPTTAGETMRALAVLMGVVSAAQAKTLGGRWMPAVSALRPIAA